jgi:predicted CxxxxCH...CXXCH cytochrome family protein
MGLTGAACTQCHNAGTTATTAPSTEHADNLIDTANTGYTDEKAKHAAGSGYGACSTAYCHSDGKGTYATPTWGSTSTGCNFCHPTLSGKHGSHTTLSGASYGSTSFDTTGGVYNFGCGNCHPPAADIALHADGSVDISLDPTDGGTLKGKNSPSAGTTGTALTTVCNLTYCHSDGSNTGAAIVAGASPAWGGTFAVNKCAGCHGNSPTTGSHPDHVMAGIHYNNIFTGTTGLKPATTRADITGQSVNLRPHGNSATATTINCNICHNSTVTAAYNRQNSQCITCHDLGQTVNATIGDADMVIAAASTSHLNGTADVALPVAATVRSKAQIRGTTAPTDWTRNNNYKDTSLASNDSATMNSAGTDWNSPGKTCTTACHLSNASPAWGTPATCDSCHTSLP